MKDDSISRQAAVDAFYEMASNIDHLCTVDDYVHVLEMLPPAQHELIRCRDCKFWQNQQEGGVEVPICVRPEYEKFPFRFIIEEDGFCSFAERRTDEQTD